MLNINYVTGLDTQDDRIVSGLEFIIDTLPHGSGIDCTWGVHKPKNGRYVYFTNSYHCMNDMGYYVGYQDFSIVIPSVMIEQVLQKFSYVNKDPVNTVLKLIAEMFTLQFNGDRYLSERYDLRDCITDTIHHALYFAEVE